MFGFFLFFILHLLFWFRVLHSDCSVNDDYSSICLVHPNQISSHQLSMISGEYHYESCHSYTNFLVHLQYKESGIFGHGYYAEDAFNSTKIYAFCGQSDILFCNKWKIGITNYNKPVMIDEDQFIVMDKSCNLKKRQCGKSMNKRKYLCIDTDNDIISGKYEYLTCKNGMPSYIHSNSEYHLQFYWSFNSYIITNGSFDEQQFLVAINDNTTSMSWWQCYGMELTHCDGKWVYFTNNPYISQQVSNIRVNQYDFRNNECSTNNNAAILVISSDDVNIKSSDYQYHINRMLMLFGMIGIGLMFLFCGCIGFKWHVSRNKYNLIEDEKDNESDGNMVNDENEEWNGDENYKLNYNDDEYDMLVSEDNVFIKDGVCNDLNEMEEEKQFMIENNEQMNVRTTMEILEFAQRNKFIISSMIKMEEKIEWMNDRDTSTITNTVSSNISDDRQSSLSCLTDYSHLDTDDHDDQLQCDV